MEKSNGGCSEATDKEMMKYLVKYVIGKPFPHNHTVMEVDDVYGIRVFSPSQILESTNGTKKNTRFIITFQKKDNCKMFSSKDGPGMWKPNPKRRSIFDSNNKKHIGNIKISWYYYYDTTDGRRKSSKRLRKSEWHMREYYLSSKYLPPNKVERKDVILTMMMKTKEQKGGNSNHDNIGKSDKEMQIIQSPQGGRLQLDHKNDNVVGISVEKQQIMQSLQSLQL